MLAKIKMLEKRVKSQERAIISQQKVVVKQQHLIIELMKSNQTKVDFFKMN